MFQATSLMRATTAENIGEDYRFVVIFNLAAPPGIVKSEFVDVPGSKFEDSEAVSGGERWTRASTEGHLVASLDD